ncbi:unnamed protein product [Oreochromis niloticus]|nr:unnamed protein product [Mustela putorius furo]
MGDIFSCISRNQTEEDVSCQQCEHHEHKRLQEEVDVRCEQSELELKQRMAEMEILYRKKVDELRLQKEANVKSELEHKERKAQMEKFYKKKVEDMRSALKKKEEELKSFKDRMAEMETFYRKKVDEIRLQREADVKSELEHKERMAEMEKFYKKKVEDMRSALKKKEEELKSFKDRMAAEITVSVRQDTKHPNIPVSKTPAEMEMLYKEKLDEMSSALKRKDDELKSVKHRMAEMETFCKKKVDEMRPAEEVFFSVMTGDTESMNNPVSKTRLTEMYTKLKLVQWPKVKDHLKSKNMNPTTTKALVQKMFKSASEEMEKKKKQIEEVFILIESSSGISPQKVKQYIQLANHNLQMSLYHSSKEDLKNLELEGQYPHDVIIKLRFMASECYWLGCLMALNNPPLYPDWKSHIPGMDAWNIFPRDIKPYFDM